MQLTLVSVALAAVATTSAVAQCEMLCNATREPVCGSNNKTYSSDCFLKYDACTTKENITVAEQGECDCDMMPINLAIIPVCGSDGVTYGDMSELEQAQCRDGMIKLAKRGECGACRTWCTDKYNPLCGSDGETYDNECDLNNGVCKNPSLTKVSNGECPGSTSNVATAKPAVKSSGVSVAVYAFTALVCWAIVVA